MDFFNKISNMASDTYKKTSEKTSKLAKETKLKMKINENKSKIDDIYNDIGKIVYQKHIREEEISIEEDLSSYCKQIDELSKEIIEYQNSILVLKQKKICSNCYMEIQNDAKYCPNCGAEQPKVNENETKIEKEETIAVEKANETEELKDSNQNK